MHWGCVDPALLAAVVHFSLFGALLGCLTGVAPGVHVNTLCLVLTSSLPVLLPVVDSAAALHGAEGAPLLVACIIMAAATSHSFLDFLPSTFLGAPDEEGVISALPGHRLLLQGRGLEAVAQAAAGSLIGGALAVTLCVPLLFVLGPPLSLYGAVDSLAPAVVVAATVLLVLSEKDGRVRAEIRVTRCAQAPSALSLVRPVPVDGEPVRMRGLIERSWRGCWIATPTGRWRLRGRCAGNVVEGVWEVRRVLWRGRSVALSLQAVSGLLGLVVMDRQLPLSDAFVGLDLSLMFPLLTGLFGVPALLSSSKGSIPEQDGVAGGPWVAPGVVGALAGVTVGWYPGITSTTGVILATSLRKRSRDDPARFITMASAVGTASAVFGVLALAVASKGRSGALLAVKEVMVTDLGAEQFSMLLIAVLVGCAVGHAALVRLGRLFTRKVAKVNVPRLNRTLLIMLVVLVIAFTGLPGLIVLAVATVLGLVPPAMGIGRVYLTGCLLLPTMLGVFGLRDELLALL